MATKDWKQIKKNNKNIVYNKSVDNELRIADLEGIAENGGWDVLIISPNRDYSKYFKSKSQALSFAKQYMRTH